MASIIPIAGLILQGLGVLSQKSAADSAAASAGKASAMQEKVMGEYLQDIQAMRPTRYAAGNALSARAASRPFYWSTWGGPSTPPPYEAPPPMKAPPVPGPGSGGAVPGIGQVSGMTDVDAIVAALKKKRQVGGYFA